MWIVSFFHHIISTLSRSKRSQGPFKYNKKMRLRYGYDDSLLNFPKRSKWCGPCYCIGPDRRGRARHNDGGGGGGDLLASPSSDDNGPNANAPVSAATQRGSLIF